VQKRNKRKMCLLVKFRKEIPAYKLQPKIKSNKLAENLSPAHQFSINSMVAVAWQNVAKCRIRTVQHYHIRS
jgi:hypothetical protein